MSEDFQAGVKAGEQSATLESLSERLERLESRVEQVLERVTLARGGLAMLIAIGSFCAAIAGAVVLWIHGGKSA